MSDFIPPKSVGALTGRGSADGNPPDLASLFKCPICPGYVLPPIFQCSAGHLVCSTCLSKLNNCCPQCRGTLRGNIRNFAIERVAETVHFPCKYGCGALLLHTEKANHEKACESRPYGCPRPGINCEWQGSLEQVLPHLLNDHVQKPSLLEGEGILFRAQDINLAGTVDWVVLQSCFGHHFILILEKHIENNEEKFTASVQLIGPHRQTLEFSYRLELNRKSENPRRLIWESTPTSIHDGVSPDIPNSDCLVFDRNIANKFSEDGNLDIDITIWKGDEQPCNSESGSFLEV